MSPGQQLPHPGSPAWNYSLTLDTSFERNARPPGGRYLYRAVSVTLYQPTRCYLVKLKTEKDPDEAGTACNFVQRGLELPAVNNISIPNFPNYRLGTGHPVCDSTIQLVTSTVRVRPPPQQVQVWPNPASGPVQVELAQPLPAGGQWRLYGSLGQLVFTGQLASGHTEHVFELDRLPPGLYFWEVVSERRRVGSGKLVILQ